MGMIKRDGDYLIIYGNACVPVIKDILNKNNFYEDYEIPKNADELIDLLKFYASKEYSKIFNANDVETKKDFSKEKSVAYDIAQSQFVRNINDGKKYEK